MTVCLNIYLLMPLWFITPTLCSIHVSELMWRLTTSCLLKPIEILWLDPKVPEATIWAFLLVQWLRLHASPAGAMVWSLVGEVPRAAWDENVLVTQLCPTLCDPMDCSPPGFSVHGILQARIQECVGISFSRVENLGLLHFREIPHHLSHQGSLLICCP